MNYKIVEFCFVDGTATAAVCEESLTINELKRLISNKCKANSFIVLRDRANNDNISMLNTSHITEVKFSESPNTYRPTYELDTEGNNSDNKEAVEYSERILP